MPTIQHRKSLGTRERVISLSIRTRWFKYDRDYLCVNNSQFVLVIFEPPCIFGHHCYSCASTWFESLLALISPVKFRAHTNNSITPTAVFYKSVLHNASLYRLLLSSIGVRSSAGTDNIYFFTASRVAEWPMQSPVWWVPGWSDWKLGLTTHLSLGLTTHLSLYLDIG
jgi:hypothetical protein